VEKAQPWHGPAALKRIRVRDALLRLAGEGRFISRGKVAEMLGVSDYLVKRMLREHGIVLPVGSNAISPAKSRIVLLMGPPP
jgi:hypothetical protein